MRVSEIAKELKISTEDILKTLKTLKLKAKGGNQELNSVVVSVLRNELSKGKKVEPPSREIKNEEKGKKTSSIEERKQQVVEEKPTSKGETKEAKISKTKPVKTKPVVKKEEPKKEISKVKKRIGKEPVITLKPLAKKRRKPFSKEDHGLLPAEHKGVPSLSSLEKESSLVSTAEKGTASALDEQLPKETVPLIDLEINVPITIKDFSIKIQQKPNVVLSQLMKMGIFAHINQGLDADIVNKLAAEFGFNVTKVKTQEEQMMDDHKQEEDDPKLLKSRAPVVTFMGHVDHGKTSLLDRIRKTKVADTEHGGITQHIGAYSVQLPKGKITFLDTPGHEAFTAMRARGAHITDIVVLVVAADEGVMPQTEEAMDHAHAAGVPIVVALNKIDREAANPDRVKKQLMEKGLNPEDWGGKTVVVGVSALTGKGIDELLELILLEAELLELKANPDKKASGIVVEAHLSQGRGSVATLIVQSGTLREGDFVIVGPHYGKVKAMFDDHKRSVKEAGPSMPIEILGLPLVPEAGEKFYVAEDEKKAKEITQSRQDQFSRDRNQVKSKITLEDLYSQIQQGSIKELCVILKADVQGSLEALRDSLGKIPSDKVKIKFIHTAVGDINTSDVLLALASHAIIIGFHAGLGLKAKEELEKNPVDVRLYKIIYDAVDDIKKALEGLLEPKLKKIFLSRIEVRQVFKLSKSGIVAGCYVTKGKVHRKASADVVREQAVVFSGQISSLKRFKDDVKEVNEGMECGLTLEGFTDYQPGDIIEAYELESVAQKL